MLVNCKSFLTNAKIGLGLFIFFPHCTDPKPPEQYEHYEHYEQDQIEKKIDYKNIKKFLQGKFKPAYHKKFSAIPKHLSIRNPSYLQTETINAFEKMARAAKKENISLYILSATRNFYAQKSIWEAKYNGTRLAEGKKLNKEFPNKTRRSLFILRYSSMPGTSRHHWGSDLDISFRKGNQKGMLTNEIYEKGEGKKVYQWMQKNARRFGFCQPYQGNPSQRNKNYKLGYQEEKWHWSYMPISKPLNLIYQKLASNLVPSGFAGSKYVKDFYKDFIFNISKTCL